MSIEENKRIVVRFMERLSSDDPDWDLLAEDARWWIQGMGSIGKSEFQTTAAGVNAMAKSGGMFLDHITAEEDRVAVESHSRIEMADGRLFENTYHFLFILKDGKIVSAREHFDTAYARDFFGAETQAGLVGSAG